MFGTGWGLAGFCPGPAISAAALGLGPVYIFLGRHGRRDRSVALADRRMAHASSRGLIETKRADKTRPGALKPSGRRSFS
jgi:hypothetical protein